MIPFFKRQDILKHIFFFESSCCTPELINLFSSRHDPERLGFIRTMDMKRADILIINGYTPEITLNKIEEQFETLKHKPTVIALGGCAIDRGPLNSGRINIPVSVFIPGCPPRPESIIDGLLRSLNS